MQALAGTGAQATSERPVTSGTPHPRYRMTETPGLFRDNQGGTVEFSAPDCGQGRFLFPWGHRPATMEEFKVKKRIIPLLLGICTAFLLCACGTPEGNPLPEGMDEAAVLEAGTQIVTDLNEGDWQAVYDLLREDAKEQTGSPDAIRDHMNTVLDKVGAFKSIETYMATGQTLKDSGEEYATAVFYCKHEKNQAMYRIAFSAEMELLGLQIKKQ